MPSYEPTKAANGNDSDSDIVTAANIKRKQIDQKRAIRKQKKKRKRAIGKQQAAEKERAELVDFLRWWKLEPEEILPHVGTEHFLGAVEAAIRRREAGMPTREEVQQRPVEREVVVQENGEQGFFGWVARLCDQPGWREVFGLHL